MDILQQLVEFFASFGYAAVFFVLLLCGFGIPIPEDITLVAGGIISGLGYTNVHIMLAIGMGGVMAGDSTMFLLGRIYGERLLQNRWIAKLMTPARFAAVQKQFDKHGDWVLFFARFLPGLRSPIFMTAGISGRISFWRFFLQDGLAACLSVPVWVYLGYYGANQREWLLRMVHVGQSGLLIALGAVIVGVGVFLFLRKRKSKSLSSLQAQDIPAKNEGISSKPRKDSSATS